MRILIIWIVCFFAFKASGQKFSKQVYILSDHFDKTKCEVDAPCDCCASDLIFLNKRNFALVDRCLHQDSYLRGKYTVRNKVMTLNFKQAVVSNDFDEVNNQDQYKKQTIKMSTLILQVTLCNSNKNILSHPTVKEYKYGSQRSRIQESEVIRELKKNKAWKLL